MVRLHSDAADYAGRRSGYLPGIGGIGFRVGAFHDAQCAVAYVDFARLAIQLKEKRSRSIGVGIAGRQKFDDERFSRLDFNGDLLARSQAVIKGGRWQDTDVRVGLAESVVL